MPPRNTRDRRHAHQQAAPRGVRRRLHGAGAPFAVAISCRARRLASPWPKERDPPSPEGMKGGKLLHVQQRFHEIRRGAVRLVLKPMVTTVTRQSQILTLAKLRRNA